MISLVLYDANKRHHFADKGPYSQSYGFSSSHLWMWAAAAAAKLLQSCQTLCDPIDSSPPGSPVPGILQARNLEWVAISFSNAWKWKVKVKLLSRVRLLATSWLQPTRLLRPWGSPGKSTGVGCHCLLLWMWELDYKESWVPKNWCFQTVVLEKTHENPLDCKEIQPVNSKGNRAWIFIGRADAEAEAPILWPPDAKSRLTGKHTDAGKDWGQEEKGVTEDKMVGRHHLLNGHEFEKTPGVGEGQGSLVCCSPWGCKESDTT